MEKSVAIFATINFSVIGLSHLLQHRGWREFFRFLHDQGRVGAFANGFLALLMGSIIVAFHRVWTGVPMILTLIGWSYVAKSAVVFLFPDWGVRSMARAQNASPLKFRIAVIGLITLAATIGACLVCNQY